MKSNSGVDIFMKTKWYLFIVTIIAVTAIIFSVLQFHQKEEPFEVGVLMIGKNRDQKFNGLKKGLEELGFDNKEITYIVKNANDDEDKMKRQIVALLDDNPDIIVTLGGVESTLLKEEMSEENKRIPVVFAGVAAPKELGLIEDYRSPGGLFTGINNYHTSISGKRLELLTNLVPSIQLVHVIYDSKIEISQLSLNETKEAAKKLNIRIHPYDVSKNSNVNLRNSIKKEEALLILPSFRIEALTDELVSLATDKQIPAMGLYEFEAEKGMLASYGASFYSQGYQAARFVSLIINGNSPADLPVELPDSIRFVINKETKDAIDVLYNQDLLSIAEYIYPDQIARGEK